MFILISKQLLNNNIVLLFWSYRLRIIYPAFLLNENNNVPMVSFQSYSKCRGFVAAQSPLQSTRTDVWEMIWQLKTKTVVLLCPLKEGTNMN